MPVARSLLVPSLHCTTHGHAPEIRRHDHDHGEPPVKRLDSKRICVLLSWRLAVLAANSLFKSSWTTHLFSRESRIFLTAPSAFQIYFMSEYDHTGMIAIQFCETPDAVTRDAVREFHDWETASRVCKNNPDESSRQAQTEDDPTSNLKPRPTTTSTSTVPGTCTGDWTIYAIEKRLSHW